MTRTENIAERLRESAELVPHQRAVVFPDGRDSFGRVKYTHLTFEQLDKESDRLARGLTRMGITPGTRIVLMVPPSLEFIALTFALFKAGAVIVLVDPGMGRKNIFNCLEEVDPAGFVGIPIVHAVRKVRSRLFPNAKLNVNVGKNIFPGAMTYQKLLGGPWEPYEIPGTVKTDPAAIIFTSGSTGPPKGVAYEHGMFAAQVDLIREQYQIQPGELDLPGFPLFALFNSAMQVTTVIPDMNPTKPAKVDPPKIIEAIRDQGITQAFGSPAMWNRIGRYCEENDIQLPTLRRILSAGAPVPVHVLRRMQKVMTQDDADIFTPYGATESLPVCSISGSEVLDYSAEKTSKGAGTCVGRTFPQAKVRIMQITDDALKSYNQVQELPAGEIGEIIVQCPSTTREYYGKVEATQKSKIPDGDSFWHRMGDVGYLDDQGLLWFCGRKAHMLETGTGRMFSIPCEAIFNEHPQVYRSALIGYGKKPHQEPVLVVEPEQGQYPQGRAQREKLTRELLELGEANDLTKTIQTILFMKALPVDTRHNVKIRREVLGPWVEEKLRKVKS